jgi:two-component system phosphate regulon sensor histidine kinase PhoR
VAPQVRGDPVLDAVFAVVTEGLVLLDASGTVVRWNAAAAEITGIPAERALGHSFAALLPVEGDVLRDATTPYAISLRRPPDDRLIRATVCSIAHAGEKRLLLALGPERRYAEIEHLKDRLVGTLSHELKTPLAAIKAYVATLRANPELYEEQRDEYLAVIEEQADRLHHTVEDLLLVSRVDAGLLPVRRMPVALDALLDTVFGALSVDLQRHRIERRTAGVRLWGDPELLRQALYHLLDNALKFSPGGGTIRITASEEAAHSWVSVSDEGIGIEAEHLPYIFDRFYRAEDALTADTGGNGLGLYLVREIARAHGGGVEVLSQPRHGSTFTLRLPRGND